MEETILTAKDLKFRYDPEQPDYALNGVSAEVKRGEFVAVLGANGCGKSTLAKHFNAILLPESGTVLVEGMDTKDEDKIYDIRQTVGMVFQSPDNQIVATVVEEDVAFALENLGVPPEEMRRRVDEAMKMAGIYEYRERAPHNLSGGQKQRVAIAGVVAMRPDCLILDEATAMLDPRGREQVMQTIHYLNRNMGITVVSITHYMEEAAQADRVLVMSKGHVVMEGTPKEVFSQTEKVRSLHLDVPQAAELRDELVKAGIPASVISTLRRDCVGRLEELYRVLEGSGIAAWQLQACSPMGNAARGLDWRMDPTEVIRFVESHRDRAPFMLGAADNVGYFTEEEPGLRGADGACFQGCRAGISAIGIDSVGNIRGCESMYDERFIEGNLRQRRLRDIWEDPETFAYNRRFTPELLTGDCARCRMGPWCAGGCRSYNYFVHGKLYEAPVCAGGAK